jgi:hypothetical protein
LSDKEAAVREAFERSKRKYGAVDPHTGYLRRLLERAATREDWETLAWRIQPDGTLRP